MGAQSDTELVVPPVHLPSLRGGHGPLNRRVGGAPRRVRGGSAILPLSSFSCQRPEARKQRGGSCSPASTPNPPRPQKRQQKKKHKPRYERPCAHVRGSAHTAPGTPAPVESTALTRIPSTLDACRAEEPIEREPAAGSIERARGARDVPRAPPGRRGARIREKARRRRSLVARGTAAAGADRAVAPAGLQGSSRGAPRGEGPSRARGQVLVLHLARPPVSSAACPRCGASPRSLATLRARRRSRPA